MEEDGEDDDEGSDDLRKRVESFIALQRQLIVREEQMLSMVVKSPSALSTLAFQPSGGRRRTIATG